MLGFVYILKSSKNGKYYVGSSKNVEVRFIEHNRGQTKSTKALIPWKLVFKQEYPNISIARSIEGKLKKFKSRTILDKIIKEGNIRIKMQG